MGLSPQDIISGRRIARRSMPALTAPIEKMTEQQQAPIHTNDPSTPLQQLLRWRAESTVINGQHGTASKILYDAYAQYCQARQITPVKHGVFCQILLADGVRSLARDAYGPRLNLVLVAGS